MKTYTREIKETKPRLDIHYDMYPSSPREWTNLGYFITQDREYNSPDINPTLQRIIKETGEVADSQAEHIELITREIHTDTDEKVIAIYPIVKYEHSGVVYSLGTKHGFDYSNNAFYIITDKTLREVYHPDTDRPTEADFKKIIEQELSDYNKYANGEVYSFTLYDTDGEVIDSCTGFYDIEDIREHLPEDWKNEKLDQYLK